MTQTSPKLHLTDQTRNRYLKRAGEIQRDRYGSVIKHIRDQFNIVKQKDISAIRAVPNEVVCSELLHDFRNMRER